jgi:VWFA-related protein
MRRSQVSASAKRPILCVIFVALFVSSPPITQAQDKPRETDYREQVQVDLVQLEVTVWPKKGDDPSMCRDLTLSDFEITINGRAREISWVDWLGSAEAMQAVEKAAIADPEKPPLTMVLFFDLWHFDTFYLLYNACPVTRPMAFDQAREMVRSQFRPGDRLLLVTFAGWPVVHEGWIRDPVQALRALDRLEVNPRVVSPMQQHLHHQKWIAGMQSLLLALGRYPGRKEMFYLGEDFPFDDVQQQVYDLAARAQANGVTIHAPDLLESCRSVPGPGCPEVTFGGLGCTEFRRPVALGYLTVNTGGEVFEGGHTLSTSVETVRRMRGCRYLVSFPMTPKEHKHAPAILVRVKRKGLQLRFPSSFGSPRREPTERERQDALFLLPRFGQGLHAEVGLWPLHPAHKKARKRWRGVMLARVRRAPEDDWPEGLERIEIEAVANRGSKIYGKFRKLIEGEDLAELRDGHARLFIFPLDTIRPGENTVALRAIGVGGEIAANVRNDLEVPRPPGPGEAGPWFLVDRLAQMGGTVTIIPALQGVLEENHGGLIVGYGCQGPEVGPGEGRLVALDHEEVVVVPVEWLDESISAPAPEGHCDWLAGPVDAALGLGLWRFEPPMVKRHGKKRTAEVEFRVVPGEEVAFAVEPR